MWEKIEHKDIDPLAFERPLSENYWLSKTWSRELPDSVRMSLSGIRAMNRTLEPEEIENVSRSVLDFCDLATGAIFVSSPLIRKKQIEGFIGYTDRIWDGALKARVIKSKRFYRSTKPLSFSAIRLQSADLLLRDLQAMLKEEDEPDFLHRPTPYAYELIEKLIKDSYTHYIGSAPVPTIAPDGDGGVSVEWMSDGESIVRLIIPASRENGKLYIYTRDPKRSHINYEVSGLAIAQQLRSVFKD